MSVQEIQSRSAWIDVAKGIAMLLIVLNHTVEGILNSGVGSRNYLWDSFHDWCYIFMVPVFVYFSGWFSNNQKKIRERFLMIGRSLLYPYLLWSVIQFSIKVVTKAGNVKAGNVNLEWSDIPGALLFGWMQFWFLQALILIMLWDTLLRLVRISFEIRIVSALLVSFFVVSFFSIPQFISSALICWIFFEMGVYVKSLNLKVRDLKIIKTLTILSFLVVTFMQIQGFGFQTQARPIAAFFGILFLSGLAYLFSLTGGPAQKFLVLLGRYSLQVYVLHVIAAAGIRTVLSRLGIDSLEPHLFLGLVFGIVGPLVFARFEEKRIGILFRLPVWNTRAKSNELPS